MKDIKTQMMDYLNWINQAGFLNTIQYSFGNSDPRIIWTVLGQLYSSLPSVIWSLSASGGGIWDSLYTEPGDVGEVGRASQSVTPQQ